VSLQDKFKLLLSDYLELGDKAGLLAILEEYPEAVSAEYGEYPDFHRITDIQLGSKIYRVCRQISQNEKLTFMAIDELRDQVSGVPLWLEGEKLKAWAEAEEDDSTDEPVDWESYRSV
jgi:hypothetical protein